jgi:GT2 family glycosyltransferase
MLPDMPPFECALADGPFGRFVIGDAPVQIAVVVVTYNSAGDIGPLIGDLRIAANDRPIRLVVVDNESSDGTPDLVREHTDAILINSGGNLGYAGGINVGMTQVGRCEAVLILNPDLRLSAETISELFDTLAADPRIGATVPAMFDSDGNIHPSLCREPSVTRALGDALFGSVAWRHRPHWLSEFDYRPSSYSKSHDVDWATGAALLIRGELARELGGWNESFFLYSEETDFFHRIRQSGHLIRYVPTAVVQHRLGGTGSSPALAALLAVNRIRYVEQYHGALYCTAFRLMVVLAEVLRSYDTTHRQALAYIANKSRWPALPRASEGVAAQQIPGPRGRGAVIVPAYNEAKVIERTLAPLSWAAVEGFIELIVVCNGCTDDTADLARTVAGARVVELDVGSKTLALNTGDDLATTWPRLYLDADIDISVEAVLAVLDRLSCGDVPAARPSFRYGSERASWPVRSYYRARSAMGAHHNALWWAGVYGLSETGHARFGRFPDVTGDDMFVDSQFAPNEKTVVDTKPSVWHTPKDVGGLLTVLGRHRRGNTELMIRDPEATPRTGTTTAAAVIQTIRGPRSTVDAVMYLGFALAARWKAKRSSVEWERDDSSRSAPV